MKRLGLVLASLSWSTVVHADEPLPRATLFYAAGETLQGCPAEGSFREQVALRLGYDPFRPEAPLHMRVTFSRDRVFHATIETAEGEAEPAVRTLDGEGSCEELAQSVVLAVSLAVDPKSFARGRSTKEAPREEARPEPTPQAPEPPAASRTQGEPTATRFVLSAGVRAGFGIVPSPSLGPLVALRTGRSLVRWHVEAGADLGTGSEADPRGGPGQVSASLLRAGAGACVVPGVFSACLRGDVGALQGSSSGIANTNASTTPYGAVALFGGIDAELGGGARFLARAEATAPVTRTTLRLDASPVWTTPAVAAGFAVALGYEF